MDTGTFIKSARMKFKVGQEAFGIMINKERNDIARYETGDTTPPGNVVLTVIELLSPKTLSSLKKHYIPPKRRKQTKCVKHNCDKK